MGVGERMNNVTIGGVDTPTEVIVSERDLSWPLALILFYSTNSMLFSTAPVLVTQLLKVVALLLPLVLRLLFWRSLRVTGEGFILKIVIFTAILMGLFPMSVVSGTAVGCVVNFVCHFLLLVLNFCVMGRGGVYNLFEKFERITIFFAVVSLFFWIFGEFLHVLSPTGTVYSGWSQSTVVTFYYLHFGAQGLRNCGQFVEAPMYNIVLCTALFFELFMRTKVSKIRLMILLLTIGTTFSTTGQLVAMASILVRFVVLRKQRMSILKLIVFTIVAIFAVVCLVVVSTMILDAKSQGASFAVRAYYMLTELRAFSEAPFIGHGYCSFAIGSSNSITLILAEGGLWLFIAYLLCLVILPFKLSALAQNEGLKYFVLFYFWVFSITVSPYLLLTYAVMSSSLIVLLVDKRNVKNQYIWS